MEVGEETPWGWQVGGDEKEAEEGQALDHPLPQMPAQEKNVNNSGFPFLSQTLVLRGASWLSDKNLV